MMAHARDESQLCRSDLQRSCSLSRQGSNCLVRSNKALRHCIYSCPCFPPVPVFFSRLWFILFLFLFRSKVRLVRKEKRRLRGKVARTRLK